MNCEKCIHYEVCDLNRRLSGNTNSLMYDEDCRLFKDKSLYIEQSEGEWGLFNLITSTYHGKQYYFLNEDGSVYSRASHSNMSRDEAINEFLDNFRF